MAMLTVLEIIQRTTEFLASKGVEGARLNSEQLVGHALGLRRMQLYLQFERLLSEPELAKIRPLVRRRANREPLQYILGDVEWGGLRLKVDRRALIPRPETEYLLELIAERAKPAPGNILDLGTGSGALALALAAAHPEARVVAVDQSSEALALARENADSTGLAARVDFRLGSWCTPLQSTEQFDLIVSNPPYLTADEVASTEPEVRDHEPRSALVAEDDGAADLLKILHDTFTHARPGAWLALETGIHQHERLIKAAQAGGWSDAASVPDLTGRARFVFARRSPVTG